MSGALSVVGSSIFDPKTCPCLCLDALPSSNMSIKAGGGDLVWQRNSVGKKRLSRQGTVEMGSSFVDSWHEWRLEAKVLSSIVNKSSRRQHKARRLLVVSEVAGQYEDSFEDVKTVRKLFLMSENRHAPNLQWLLIPSKDEISFPWEIKSSKNRSCCWFHWFRIVWAWTRTCGLVYVSRNQRCFKYWMGR